MSQFKTNKKSKGPTHRLGRFIRVYRGTKNAGVREIAKEIGVSASTVTRIELGGMWDLHTHLRLMKWLLEKTNE